MLEAICGCDHKEQAENKDELMGKMKEHFANSPDCAKQVEGKSEEETKEMLDAITKEV